ncbi:MAG: glycosyltransferase [Muribaculaceae bacterium]|nr:glycosyltransferase [Muribaculaceae bacterium]
MGKRILLVNKFFYTRGGAEVVAINLRDELTARGYVVGIFTMAYHHVDEVEYLYEAPEVSFKRGLAGKVKFARRTLGGYHIEEAFTRALDDFKPDVVHLHNIHSYLSPAVARLAHERRCRVVWTMHDYKLVCPSYSCLNHGQTCERCLTHRHAILTQRCFKDSYAAGALAWLEARRWNRRRLEQWVDALVCPSEFLHDMMLRGGWNPDKLHVLNNFIDPVKLRALDEETLPREDYVAYVGRLSHEKGVDTLLQVARETPSVTLKLAGNGPLRLSLTAQYGSLPNVEFVGQLDAAQVANFVSRAACMVVPSEWYENNPLTIIEAQCAGTPVVGSNMGGIPELVVPGNGIIFEAGDRTALTEALDRALHTEWDHAGIRVRGRKRFSADVHLARLLKLYFSDLS